MNTTPYDGYKSGYVALVGKPNVGKSTLLNDYVGQMIAAVSAKPQTTRRRQLGIITLENAQIVFVDTPGMHKGDYKLSRFINEEAQFALMDADLILFIVDASLPPDSEDQALAAEISSLKTPPNVLLVLNKIDLIPPDLVPERRELFSRLMAFTDVVQISALTAPGREQLLEKVIEMLPEGPRYFPEDQITDIYERDIAEDLIRAAALENLHEEVPYGIFVRVDDYQVRNDDLRYIHATILVERDSHKGIVIGKRGSMIKKISTQAREKIEELSGEKVYLELQVKVEKNWRNNQDFLRRVGLSHD
ncbi:MAG: GTPase Era [Anaerolineaceae bacterium]|nr:GTPase Era [Anaerolineaceae bacterium]